MKKIKKKCRDHWTNHVRAIILTVLFLNQVVFSLVFANSSEFVTLADAQIGQVSAGNGASLSEDLAETRRQLQRMRILYAELLLENRELLDELTDLRLQAANLMGADREVTGTRRQAVALSALLEVQQQHAELYREVYEFGDYLQTVLQILEPSQVLRREIEQRYGILSQAVAHLENLPSIVAWRGGDPVRGRNEARILRVEESLQVVILGVGENEFVRPGSEWRITDALERPVAHIKVVETRASLSAGIPITGNLAQIVPGMKAELVQFSEE